MIGEQLNQLFPLFSTHLGFRASIGPLIFPFKYLRVKIKLRIFCIHHRTDSYIFCNENILGLGVRRPEVMSYLSLCSFVIYCRNVRSFLGEN
jgi:hypothetical protein